MNISLLGTGNMAAGLAVLFAKASHTVTLGSRDAEKAKVVASKIGNGITGAELAEAARKADLVVLAVRQWADPRSLGVEGRVRF